MISLILGVSLLALIVYHWDLIDKAFVRLLTP